MLTLVQRGDTTVTGLFATQAFDYANLLMLAAQQARSTQARAIQELVPGISVGGSQCQSFESCASLLSDGRNIDYDSPGGMLSLGVNGAVREHRRHIGLPSSIPRSEVIDARHRTRP